MGEAVNRTLRRVAVAVARSRLTDSGEVGKKRGLSCVCCVLKMAGGGALRAKENRRSKADALRQQPVGTEVLIEERRIKEVFGRGSSGGDCSGGEEERKEKEMKTRPDAAGLATR